jgi:hypothetical protein
VLPQQTYTARVMYKEEPLKRTSCQRHLHEHCDGCARSRPESRASQDDPYSLFRCVCVDGLLRAYAERVRSRWPGATVGVICFVLISKKRMLSVRARSSGPGPGVTLSGEPPRLVERQHPFRFISCGVNLGKGIDMPSTGQLHTYAARIRT